VGCCRSWEEEVAEVEVHHRQEQVLGLRWVSCCRRHRGKPGLRRYRCCSK